MESGHGIPDIWILDWMDLVGLRFRAMGTGTGMDSNRLPPSYQVSSPEYLDGYVGGERIYYIRSME